MRNDDGLTPAERELEAALGSLTPAQAMAGRDRVMFSAGRASVRRQSRIWQGVSSCLTVMLLAAIVSRPRASVVEMGVGSVAGDVQSVSPAGLSTPPSDPLNRRQLEPFIEYVRTRRAVLERGVEALPALDVRPAAGTEPPLTRENLDEILSST